MDAKGTTAQPGTQPHSSSEVSPETADPCDCSQDHRREEPPAQEQLAEQPHGALTRLFVSMVRFYQRNISPLKPPVCRFAPSCSEYTRQAIVRYGAFKGTWMGMRRLSRCHPFHPGGYDPVP